MTQVQRKVLRSWSHTGGRRNPSGPSRRWSFRPQRGHPPPAARTPPDAGHWRRRPDRRFAPPCRPPGACGTTAALARCCLKTMQMARQFSLPILRQWHRNPAELVRPSLRRQRFDSVHTTERFGAPNPGGEGRIGWFGSPLPGFRVLGRQCVHRGRPGFTPTAPRPHPA